MMNNERRHQMAEFLRQRRARLSPFEVGLPPGERRRTPGLRRSEIAQLAGMSVDWYTWLEQGREINVSEQVLSSLARALQLDAAETAYLLALAFDRPAMGRPVPVSSAIQTLLDLQGVMPAFVLNYCWDVVAWNQSACAIVADFGALPPQHRNVLWLTLTEPLMRQMLRDWPIHAQRIVAEFRMSSRRYTEDSRIQWLIQHLQEQSPEFRQWWSSYDVTERVSVRKESIHPTFGLLSFDQVVLHIHADPPLRMHVLVPVDGTPTLAVMHEIARQMAAPEK